MFVEPDWQKITTADTWGYPSGYVCSHTLSDTVSLSSFSRLFQIGVFCLLLFAVVIFECVWSTSKSFSLSVNNWTQI